MTEQSRDNALTAGRLRRLLDTIPDEAPVTLQLPDGSILLAGSPKRTKGGLLPKTRDFRTRATLTLRVCRGSKVYRHSQYVLHRWVEATEAEVPPGVKLDAQRRPLRPLHRFPKHMTDIVCTHNRT